MARVGGDGSHLCGYRIRRIILEQSKRAHVGHLGRPAPRAAGRRDDGPIVVGAEIQARSPAAGST